MKLGSILLLMVSAFFALLALTYGDGMDKYQKL